MAVAEIIKKQIILNGVSIAPSISQIYTPKIKEGKRDNIKWFDDTKLIKKTI